MVPLIKRSTDSLVAVLGEKATAEVTFEAIEYVCLLNNCNNTATIYMYLEIFARRKFSPILPPALIGKKFMKFFRGYGDLYHIGEIFFCKNFLQYKGS